MYLKKNDFASYLVYKLYITFKMSSYIITPDIRDTINDIADIPSLITEQMKLLQSLKKDTTSIMLYGINDGMLSDENKDIAVTLSLIYPYPAGKIQIDLLKRGKSGRDVIKKDLLEKLLQSKIRTEMIEDALRGLRASETESEMIEECGL